MSLRLEGVSKTVRGETHIHPLDLELDPGSLNVLLGHTQAGKTTLMRLMAGLDRPTSGRVQMDGTDVTRVPVQKRRVAMVYQQFINYPSLSVHDNIASPLKLQKLPAAEIRQRVGQVAEMLHLEPLLDRLPQELSGGQQQRTAIARALVKDAKLLLLDEPLVNLDYKLREELRTELRSIFQQRKTMVVYSTTEPHEALIMGGNVLVMHEGRVLQKGATTDVFHRPATQEVGRVFSDPPMNFAPGRVAEGSMWIGDLPPATLSGHLRQLQPGEYSFGCHASHIFLRPGGDDDIAIPCEVDLAEISGSETFIHMRHSNVGWVVQEEGVHNLRLGERITVYLQPRHLFAFDAAGTLAAAPKRS